MNFFDHGILTAFTALANKSYVFDTAVYYASLFYDVKGGLIVALLYGLVQSGREERAPEIFATILVGCAVAVAATRLIAIASPMRVRPVLVPHAFRFPLSMDPHDYDNWSSFPSDHASLYGALSFGLYRIDRRVGLFAGLWTAVVICLARVYLGLHYPTDVLTGLAIGAAAMAVAASRPVAARVTPPAQAFRARSPFLFYTVAYLLTFEIASIFDGTHAFAKLAVRGAHALLAHLH